MNTNDNENNLNRLSIVAQVSIKLCTFEVMMFLLKNILIKITYFCRKRKCEAMNSGITTFRLLFGGTNTISTDLVQFNKKRFVRVKQTISKWQYKYVYFTTMGT